MLNNYLNDQKNGSSHTIMLQTKTDDLKTNQDIPVKGKSDSLKSILVDIRTILYAITFGILFGFFINKGMVFIAPTIRKQMIFERFAMLKMFLAAVGTSMLSVAMLEIIANKLYNKILNGYIEHNNRRNSKSRLFFVWK